MQLFAKFEQNSVGWVQSNLKFSKIYGGSEPTAQNYSETLQTVAFYHDYYNSIKKNGGHPTRI